MKPRHFWAFVRDQPFWVDAILTVIVAAQFAATLLGYIPNIGSGLIDRADQGPVQALYLALLGPAAIVAGFAGVVVVFGLTANGDRFQKFRADAGPALTRTWVASTLSGFEAVVLGLTAAVLSVVGVPWLAPSFFELALLVLIHGALRLVWILSALIGIVRAEDITNTDATNVYSMDKLFHRNAG
ncbi:hypothetical protein [Cryobacterium sp. PH29-G1]|uniref:hypothetical protein n=1 Tax=Cryobacterium sp. PH29-G1 TaxID=3046211 RepID=UPI0024BB0FFD|nr:hypothetical protein [Cryobacterium sp. PH29-G1]MDJ0350606.1 hypothetical protein [Cryobacterium sp. PH29-G1]